MAIREAPEFKSPTEKTPEREPAFLGFLQRLFVDHHVERKGDTMGFVARSYDAAQLKEAIEKILIYFQADKNMEEIEVHPKDDRAGLITFKDPSRCEGIKRLEILFLNESDDDDEPRDKEV